MAKWGGPSGHLTSPLNPQKKTPEKINKNLKKRKKARKKQVSFSAISQDFQFCFCPKNPLLQPGPKARTQKHCKNRGFGTPIFENKYGHELAILDPNKHKTQNSNYHFLPFSSLWETKHKKC